MTAAVAARAVGPSAEPRRPALEASDLRFAYGPRREILRIPELRVDTGSSVLLFGPSGSGKTTLLGLLAGVLTASSGRLSVLGHDLTQMSNAQRDRFRGSHIGYIFQLFNLIPYLTVLENITLPCRLSRERHERLNGVPVEQAAHEVAEHLGIAPLLGERALNLSVGQQQRVATLGLSAGVLVGVALTQTQAFLVLEREYRANAAVVRERLYRDAVDRAIGVAMVRWVPPPVNGKYNGFRITLAPPGAGQASAVSEDEDNRR